MKGQWTVIGKQGEKYYYRYSWCAFSKYLKIYGYDTKVAHYEQFVKEGFIK